MSRMRPHNGEPMPVNLLVHLFDVFSLEERPTDDEGVESDTDCPGVNFETVSVHQDSR